MSFTKEDIRALNEGIETIAREIKDGKRSIDSIGPIELGPDTQTAIILHALIARSSMQPTSQQLSAWVSEARELQKEIRRTR